MKLEVMLAIAIPSFLLGVAAERVDSVGGRAPSPSPGVATATPAVSEMAPARPLATGASGTVVGGDGGSAPLVDTTPLSEMASGWIPAPASTVTQSALTAVPSATAYVAVGPVPATPVTTARPVETIAPKSDISALIAASSWPQSLWGTVACLVERESKGNAGAIGKAGERGLMQVGPANITFLAEKGIAWDALFDGATNLRAGWILYVWWQGVNGDGLTPWRSTRGGCA